MPSDNTVSGANPVNPVNSFKVEESKDIFKIKENERDIKNQVISALWNIFSVIVFPVGLCRLLMGRLVVPISALPAVTISWNPAIKKQNEIKYNIAVKKCQEFKKVETPKKITVITADDVELDTVAIINKGQEFVDKKDKKWILYLNGNGGCYEDSMQNLIHTSAETGANIYTGNYRGVMNSKGYPTSSKDLVVDAEAMVQYLLSEGVKPENILVHGWSIGGAVATEVVSLHQEEGNCMHLCTERSFSTF